MKFYDTEKIDLVKLYMIEFNQGMAELSGDFIALQSKAIRLMELLDDIFEIIDKDKKEK